MKYAFIVKTADGFEVWIGRDVPGEASHGAATCAGIFQSEEKAREFATARGAQIRE